MVEVHELGLVLLLTFVVVVASTVGSFVVVLIRLRFDLQCNAMLCDDLLYAIRNEWLDQSNDLAYHSYPSSTRCFCSLFVHNLVGMLVRISEYCTNHMITVPALSCTSQWLATSTAK
jgi:hypothetical protein